MDEFGRRKIDWNAELRTAAETPVSSHPYFGILPVDPENPYKGMVGKQLLQCSGGTPLLRHDVSNLHPQTYTRRV